MSIGDVLSPSISAPLGADNPLCVSLLPYMLGFAKPISALITCCCYRVYTWVERVYRQYYTVYLHSFLTVY